MIFETTIVYIKSASSPNAQYQILVHTSDGSAVSTAPGVDRASEEPSRELLSGRDSGGTKGGKMNWSSRWMLIVSLLPQAWYGVVHLLDQVARVVLIKPQRARNDGGRGGKELDVDSRLRAQKTDTDFWEFRLVRNSTCRYVCGRCNL